MGAADVAAVGDGRGVHVVGGSGAVEDRGGSPETLKSSLSHPYKCSNRPGLIPLPQALKRLRQGSHNTLPLSIPLSIPLQH